MSNNHLKPGVIERIAELTRSSASVRAIASQLGIAKHTAEKYRRIVAQAEGIKCLCGGPLTHRGWCRPRYLQSEGRQAWMESQHDKNGMLARRQQQAVIDAAHDETYMK